MPVAPVSQVAEEAEGEALRIIVGALGDRLELISPTDYRALRESDGGLPSPAAIWELFGGFHRMRECAMTMTVRRADA